MIVGVDSQVLIYANIAPRTSAPKPENFDDLQLRSRLLIQGLSDSGDTIVLPMIVVSELLTHVPESSRGAFLAELSRMFVCKEFDLPAAAIAADLWSQRDKVARGNIAGERIALRADTLIVASAKSAGATEFFSHDERCRAIADLAGLKGRDLPKEDKDNMFLSHEIRRGER